MDFSTLGKGILVVGVVLVVVGGLIWVLGRTGLPLGRLPGDVQIEGEMKGRHKGMRSLQKYGRDGEQPQKSSSLDCGPGLAVGVVVLGLRNNDP